jgi:hypothetical protein
MGLARSSLFGFATTVTAERAAMGVPAKAARGAGIESSPLRPYLPLI